MTNRLKKIYIVALAAILSICAGFALLISRPASASAENAVKMTIYYGNTGEKLTETTIDTLTGARLPESVESFIVQNFGADESGYYGVQSFDTTADGSNAFVSINTFFNSTFFSVKDMDIYIYSKEPIKLALKDGTETKGYLTVPYDKKINEVTLEEINAVEGIQKDGFLLKGFTPNGTDSTFPKEGVRSLSLEYGKAIAVVFKNEDGSKILCTKYLAAGSIYDTRDDTEIQTAAKKEGYTLKGWRGTLDSDFVINKIPISESDMILYAVYEENISNTVTITFKDGETVLYTAQIPTGDALTLADYPELEEKVKKAGYIFKGWQSEGGTFVEAGSLRLLNAYKDTMYTAVYESTGQKRYGVYFYVDGEERVSHSAKVGVDIIFSDYADVLALQEKEGYTFKGWRKRGDENGELLTEKYVYQVCDEVDGVELEAVFVKKSSFEKSSFEKNFGIGISTGGAVVIGIAVYFLFFRRRRR